MLQALQELDLTACSKLTDASLAQVWDWGCGWAEGPGLEPGAWVHPLFALKGFLSYWLLLWMASPFAGGGEPRRTPGSWPSPTSSILQVLQFPQLRQLSLSLLPALTDKGLVAVARGCHSLERLALSHCSLLSDEGWAQAASSWPRLQHLNLSSCSRLTEQ